MWSFFEDDIFCTSLRYNGLYVQSKPPAELVVCTSPSMYKCEPVVEDGGKLVIYAPHIDSFSLSHGHIMQKTGYHVRDYYLKQMDRFRDIPKAAMAVSTYLKGTGTFNDGVEKPRIKVTLATGISREECESAGLAYLAPESVNPNEWRNKGDEGILFVEKGGETLYKEAGK